jgi:pyrimidine operon attenuation protein/uracil phosphoribosyltransferase
VATKLYDAAWVQSAFAQLAAEILAAARGAVPALIGIRTRGAEMAERIAAALGERGAAAPHVGYLDPTLFRDDLHAGGGLKGVMPTDIDFDLNGANIVLIDDVILTGRSVRAALNTLFAYGRPARVDLCVMVDRGGRELPLQPNFCAARIDVPAGGYVRVKLTATDKRPDAIYVVGAGDAEP